MVLAVIFPMPLRPKEIPVVVLLLFLLLIIFVGIWFLAKHMVSPDSFPIVLLVLTLLGAVLYVIGFLKIMIYLRKNKDDK